jgi:hypothetical protein
VIDVFAPGFIGGIGAAYRSAPGGSATSAVPERVAI